MPSQSIRFLLTCFSLILSLCIYTTAEDSPKPGFEGIVTQSSEEVKTGVAEEKGEKKVKRKKGPSQEEIARSILVDQSFRQGSQEQQGT